MSSAWAKDIIHYWFDHLGPRHWFDANQDVDSEIAERFEPLWASLRHESHLFFLSDPLESLGAILLFDQFPRNMFRGQIDGFVTDRLALKIADGAIEAGFDAAHPPEKRGFIYIPFMHSERMDDQDRSVILFDTLGRREQLDFAIMHRDVIKRFGRFPHRNEILGRETSKDEVEFLSMGRGW